MPPRAIHPEDKQRKREAILDAAQQLWTTHTDRLSNMDALAQASGVAKGTLYLYFRSKEEVLLAVHERDVLEFFQQLIQRAQAAEPMQLQDMTEIVINCIQQSSTFLPLSSFCLGMMERQIPQEIALEFRLRTFQALDEVVSTLRQHFPSLTCLHMMQGYALMLGQWQLLQQSSLNQLVQQHHPRLPADCLYAMDEASFLDILRHSLLTLFSGLLASSEAA